MAGFRTVVLNNSCFLSLKNKQLCIDLDGDQVSVPLEDISCIILGNHAISMTHPVLSACALESISLICIDKSFMPIGMLVSQARPSPAVRVAQCQRSLSKRFRERVWKDIIQHKITLQAMLLGSIGNSTAGDRLHALSKQVTNGDPSNIESYASRIYFPRVFGTSFSRKSVSTTNACLNYGYALIRARLAQFLTASGCVLSWGIHHHSVENPCNLVDDVIEVFRPVVDSYVYHNLVQHQDFDDTKKRLGRSEKTSLHGIFTLTLIDSKHAQVVDCLYALQLTVQRFARALQSGHTRELIFCSFDSKHHERRP